jgi:hypothetical protein
MNFRHPRAGRLTRDGAHLPRPCLEQGRGTHSRIGTSWATKRRNRPVDQVVGVVIDPGQSFSP